MSLQQLDAVWRHSRASGNLLLVALAAADSASDGELYFLDLDFIARKSRLPVHQVGKLLKKLERLGEVELLSEKKRGPFDTLICRFLIEETVNPREAGADHL